MLEYICVNANLSDLQSSVTIFSHDEHEALNLKLSL